jgi:hypothetical protein
MEQIARAENCVLTKFSVSHPRVPRAYPVRGHNTGRNISVLCMLGYEPSIFYKRQSAL